jgi:hypothetical protein
MSLATLASGAIERLGLVDVMVPVALTGGLFANPMLYRQTTEHLASLAANARAVKPLYDPAMGAARMAMEGA